MTKAELAELRAANAKQESLSRVASWGDTIPPDQRLVPVWHRTEDDRKAAAEERLLKLVKKIPIGPGDICCSKCHVPMKSGKSWIRFQDLYYCDGCWDASNVPESLKEHKKAKRDQDRHLGAVEAGG